METWLDNSEAGLFRSQLILFHVIASTAKAEPQSFLAIRMKVSEERVVLAPDSVLLSVLQNSLRAHHQDVPNAVKMIDQCLR